MKRILDAVALTLALYGFAAWVYVAVTAITPAPDPAPSYSPTSTSWPRTDTFGAFAFTLSLLSFLVFILSRER